MDMTKHTASPVSSLSLILSTPAGTDDEFLSRSFLGDKRGKAALLSVHEELELVNSEVVFLEGGKHTVPDGGGKARTTENAAVVVKKLVAFCQ